MLEEDECYRAVRGRDSRFDGVFFTAVVTTGVYCRPSCPARLPLRRNVRFFSTSAAAQHAGFRACKRCRPAAAPGSPEWNHRADVAARALRLIGEGIVDREGVPGLARRLGYSERQVHRALHGELGIGPIALARAQRCETARVLLEGTDLAMSEVAFAAGFSSIRQFNDTMINVYGEPPRVLRGGSRHPRIGNLAPASIALHIPYRPPLDLDALFDFLGARCVPGVEEMVDATYRRVLRLPRGLGIVGLRRGIDREERSIEMEVQLDDLRDLTVAVARCRRLLDLDTDPQAILASLCEDPVIGDLVSSRPGLRVPGQVDAEELAIRAVLGQQVSVAAARRLAGELVAKYGEPLAISSGSLTHAFPGSSRLAPLDDLEIGMPRSRRQTILALCRALESGSVDLSSGADRDEAASSLERIVGVGPWTSSYIRLRGLGDPDAFLPGDLGIRRALAARTLRSDPKSAAELAQRWRPWRSYALMHLWCADATSRSSLQHHALKGALVS